MRPGRERPGKVRIDGVKSLMFRCFNEAGARTPRKVTTAGPDT